jgi:hypothetical protein
MRCESEWNAEHLKSSYVAKVLLNELTSKYGIKTLGKVEAGGKCGLS